MPVCGFRPLEARHRGTEEMDMLASTGTVRQTEAAVLASCEPAALEPEMTVAIAQGGTLLAIVCLRPTGPGDVYPSADLSHLASLAETVASRLRRLGRQEGMYEASAMLASPAAEVAALEPLRPAVSAQVFRPEGEFWTLAYAEREIRLRDLRGLHYLAELLRQPGREFHVSDLVGLGRREGAAEGACDPALRVVRGLGDTGERLDGRARAEYRARLAELAEEEAAAERCHDLGRLERLRSEREALVDELSRALRGPGPSSAERARVAVTKAIGAALARVGAHHPALGAHLMATVRRGYFCSYTPDPSHLGTWAT